jgi:serine/threonine protein kinase
VKRAIGRRTDLVEMLLNEFFILELLADVPALPRPITFDTRSAAFDMFVGRDFLEYLIDIGSPNYDRLSVMYLFESVFKTLADIHSHGIAHGDIKLENILVNRTNNSATLIDFGHASVFRIGAQEFNVPIKLGTPGYFPPEHRILARKDTKSPRPEKADSRMRSTGSSLRCPHRRLCHWRTHRRTSRFSTSA